jgi:hypothetical protein
MKNAAVVFALMLTVMVCRAQEVASLSRDRSSIAFVTENFSDIKRLPGYRMRNTGRALTIGGLTLLTGGLILMNSGGPRSTHPNVTGDEPDWREPLGFTMAYSGVGVMIPGIILWKKGSRKYKRSLEREQYSIETDGASIALRYSF